MKSMHALLTDIVALVALAGLLRSFVLLRDASAAEWDRLVRGRVVTSSRCTA